MKSRALAVATSSLLTLTLALPAVAQSGPQQTQSSSGTQQPQKSKPIPVDVSTQSSGDQTQPVTGPAPAEPGAAPKETHNKNKNDIEDIGDRKVGGRGLGDWYSTDTEIKMGKQYAMMVESSVRMIQDPVITEYVNRIGQNLVRNSDAKVPFTIKVIDSDEINAFALPGGFFYVNSGLILAADEEAELAGVMAHEIAHVCARHAMREQTRMNYASMASIPLIFHRKLGHLRSGQPGAEHRAAHDLHEVLAQLRIRSRLSGSAVHVQGGIRSRSLHHLLREDRGAGEEAARHDREGVHDASAYARAHREEPGRDSEDLCPRGPNTS